MFRYMLDTDIASYIMKRSSEAVLRKLQTVAASDCCISAITQCELTYGVELSPRQEKNRSELDAFLQYVGVLDFPGAASADYARIRAGLKARGAPIGSNDLLIAAHALYLDLTLVTNNLREFGRVQGLKVENWA